MLGINEIIKVFINENNFKAEDRIKILRANKENIGVTAYLIHKFQNLKIEVLGEYEGKIMELASKDLLLGYCWQTTESAIIFLNDDDYIERGNLYLEENDKLYHSWICFKYKNRNYVFDPCLNILCKKTLYYKIFKPEVKATVSAKTIRNYLIESIQNPNQKQEGIYYKKAEEFMSKFFGSAYEKQREYKKVETSNNVSAPMYRHSTGYKANIENGKIKVLVAHYYRNDG